MTEAQPRNRVGRPPVPGTAGVRVPLSLRLTADLKDHLMQTAKACGRSISQEAELRLEQSFRDDLIVSRILAAVSEGRT